MRLPGVEGDGNTGNREGCPYKRQACTRPVGAGPAPALRRDNTIMNSDKTMHDINHSKPRRRPRRPEWLRDELRRLETEEQHLQRAIASLETFQARHGDDTDSEVILGLDEARQQLKEVTQRRLVLVRGWRVLCEAVCQVQL